MPTQERGKNSQAVTSPGNGSSLGTRLGPAAANKGGVFGGFFFCFTWSPILMRGHDNHSSGLANIKPVKSIYAHHSGNRVLPASSPAREDTGCSAPPAPTPPTLTPLQVTRLHATPEVRHPTYSNCKDCCQLSGYRVERIKNFACSRTFQCFNSSCCPLPSPNTWPSSKPGTCQTSYCKNSPRCSTANTGPRGQTMRVGQGESIRVSC